MSVAAIIVTHNSAAVISSCLTALARYSPEVELLVVDNASADRTLELARQHTCARVIANAENLGFAGAVNRGVCATQAEYLLLVNPDAQIRTSVRGLVEGSRQYGLAAGQLVNTEGQPQTGFGIRRFPTPTALCFEVLGLNRLIPQNPVNRHYRYLDQGKLRNQPSFVEQPAGAFLMFRRDVWERLQGFDESFYPVWFEDVDFCYRAVSAGYRIQYFPQIQARHLGGHSVSALTPRCRALYWYGSLLRYAAKHLSTAAQLSIRLSTMMGAVPRMIAGMIGKRNLAPVVTYCSIISMAVRGNSQRRFVSEQHVVRGKAGQ